MTNKKVRRRKKRMRSQIGQKGRVVQEMQCWLKEMELLGFQYNAFIKERSHQVAVVWSEDFDRRAVLAISRFKKSPKKRWRVTAHIAGATHSQTVRQVALYGRLDDALQSVKSWLLNNKLSQRGLNHATKARNW
jgi:hypothetical protein